MKNVLKLVCPTFPTHSWREEGSHGTAMLSSILTYTLQSMVPETRGYPLMLERWLTRCYAVFVEMTCSSVLKGARNPLTSIMIS